MRSGQCSPSTVYSMNCSRDSVSLIIFGMTCVKAIRILRFSVAALGLFHIISRPALSQSAAAKLYLSNFVTYNDSHRDEHVSIQAILFLAFLGARARTHAH